MATTSEEIILRINGKEAAATFNDLKTRVAILNKQLGKLTPGTEAFNKKLKELQQGKKSLADINTQIRGVRKNVDKSSKALDNMNKKTSGIVANLKSFGAAALASFSVDQIIGLTNEVLNLDKAIIKLQGDVSKLTGLQGEALEEAAANIKSLASVFGFEENELLRTANALSKTFDTSFNESIALIEKASLAGFDLNAAGLDVLAEYAVNFKELGFQQEEFVALSIQLQKKGAFSDFGQDLFKNLNIKLREQTGATRKALEAAFGADFTTGLFKRITDGATTTAQAFEEIRLKIKGTNLQTNVLQTLVTDVFGSKGEDLTVDFITSLKTTGQTIDDLIDETNKLTASQRAQLELNKELTKAQIELSKQLDGSGGKAANLMLKLKILGTVGLGKLIGFLKEMAAASQPIIDFFKELAEDVNDAWTMINNILMAFGDFNAKSLLVQASVKSLQLVFISIFGPLKFMLNAFVEITKESIEFWNASKNLRGSIFALTRALVQLGKNVKDSVVNELEGLMDIIIGLATFDYSRIEQGFKKGFEGIKLATVDIGKGVSDAFAEGFKEGEDFLVTTISESRGMQALFDLFDKGVKKGKKFFSELAAAQAAHQKQVEKERNAAAVKSVQRTKKTTEDLKKAREKAAADRLKAKQNIDKLLILSIEDDFERRKKIIENQAQIEINIVVGFEQQKAMQRKLITEKMLNDIADLEKKHAAENQKTRQKELSDEISFLEESRRLALLNIENEKLTKDIDDTEKKDAKQLSFEEALEAQRKHDNSVFDLNNRFLQAELDSIEAENGKETIAFRTKEQELLMLRKDFSKKNKELGEDDMAARRAMTRERIDLGIEIFNFTASLLKKDKATIKAAIVLEKSAAIADVIISAQREIAGYYVHGASVATLGTVGTIKAALTSIRALASIATIVTAAQGFEFGGPTKALGAAFGTFAGGGHVNSPSLGLIGEKGPEYVIPNRMLDMFDLKSIEKVRVGAFQAGGSTQQPIQTTGTIGNAPENLDIIEELTNMNVLLNSINDNVAAWPDELKVVNDLVEVREGIKVINKIKQQSTL